MSVIMTKNLQESMFTSSTVQRVIESRVSVTHARAREKTFRFAQNLTDWNSSMDSAHIARRIAIFRLSKGFIESFCKAHSYVNITGSSKASGARACASGSCSFATQFTSFDNNARGSRMINSHE